jgi:hypothetical protein
MEAYVYYCGNMAHIKEKGDVYFDDDDGKTNLSILCTD